MPAKMLTQESFVEGFGEGTQDAYAVAQYVDRQRIEMQPIYEWFDIICMYRAWNPEFYEGIRKRYDAEYGLTRLMQQLAFRDGWMGVWKSNCELFAVGVPMRCYGSSR